MLKSVLAVAAAIAGFAVLPAKADHVFDVNFENPQYVFMCHTPSDLEYVINGMQISNAEGRERLNAKRLPAVAGNAPPCNYITDTNGDYFLMSGMTNIELISAMDAFGGQFADINVGMYRATSTSGASMYMIIAFPVVGNDVYAGAEYITFTLGVQ